MPSSLARGAACAALLVALVTSPATAQTSPDTGLLSITPAKRDLEARPPVVLGTTRVQNTTRLPFRVRVFPALLRQQLDGSFTFDESRSGLATARARFDALPRRFRLAPGDARDLTLRWKRLRRGKRTAYIGVVVEGTPQPGDEAGVSSVLRLVGTNFLRLPGRYRVAGRLTSLRAESDAGVLRLFARLRNSGEVHAAPRGGSLTIEDSSGRRVARASWDGDVVLPGAEREYPVEVTRTLPAGRYTAVAAATFGGRRSSATAEIELSGPNQLASASLALEDVRVSGEQGEPARVSARVTNNGAAAGEASLELELLPVPGGTPGRPIARETVEVGQIGPGDAQEVTADLGRLRAGNHRVRARLIVTGSPADEASADFVPTASRGALEEAGDIASDNLPWIIGAALLAGLGAVLVRERSRRRALEERLGRGD